jgi:hypothetical protein
MYTVCSFQFDDDDDDDDEEEPLEICMSNLVHT